MILFHVFPEILTSYTGQHWFLADLMSQHQNNICLEYNIYVYPQPQLPCLKSYITIYTRLQLNIQPVLGSKELQCGHNQKNTDTEEKKGNTENTES